MSHSLGFRPAAAALAAFLAGPAVSGGDVLPGPVPAEVVGVVDGDTIDVRARIWLGQEVRTRVRIAGIDAPELRGACVEEKARARAARTRMEALVGGGTVVLRDIRLGKYAGRVVARVETAGGREFGALLLEEGLARPYGAARAAAWCAETAPPVHPVRDGATKKGSR